ncbi:YitT family protein [Proteiniclasticum sp. QWL-01]|uniref:YitT family protein n=1 Tax=Proteiniclasticum sp. QWL-01 TaxID=3036945 RepID=UPI00240F6034|nr:YitT family protein [Proteiniclasticum sp. QWL-01]WFF72328.1 YitT family protein [Proteiniclasticum sp. QWL-01]
MFTKNNLRDYLMISLGVILVAVSLHFFYFPSNLAAGGISGIAIIMGKLYPVISKAIYILVLNVVFFGIGFLFLGKVFGAKTIYASFFMNIVLAVLQSLVGSIHLTNDMFLNTFYGTALSSVGMAIVFNFGGSTGGTDIVAKIISKFFHFDLGKSLLMVDFIITAGGLLVFGWEVGLFSLLSVLINGNLIDRFIEGTRTAKEIMIISQKSEAIRQFIIEKLDRSCTMLKGYGGFTREDTEVIYVVMNRRNYIDLKNFIKEVDPKAFLSVNEVREVLGEGYQDISIL